MAEGVALFCLLYPESQGKQGRCLDLLRRSAREYYRAPKAKCTTWSYFTPFPPPKPGEWDSQKPMIGGLEIYTSKQALQAQVNDPVYFQSYHDTVKRENLYSKPEELVAWYHAVGFIARETEATVKDGGVLISVAKMVSTDSGEILELLKSFAEWVQASEPGVLTYAAFTRRKAPKEIMLFVRYKDVKALKSHDGASQHRIVVKKLAKLMENDMKTSTTLWKEVADSFVSNIVGGGDEASVSPKL